MQNNLIAFPKSVKTGNSGSLNCDRKDSIRVISARLYGAKRRCGPRAKPSDREHYAGISFDIPNIATATRELYSRLGPIPPGWSIDRINPWLGYSIANIRWASASEQRRNQRYVDDDCGEA